MYACVCVSVCKSVSVRVHLHDLLGEAHTAHALLVLLLEDRAVAVILLAQVRPHEVQQPEARAAPVGAAVGQEDSRCAAPKEAVGEEHRAVVPAVPVLRDVLCRHNQRERVVLVGGAQQLAGQIEGDERRGATHPAYGEITRDRD